jgi:hypothetical protein
MIIGLDSYVYLEPEAHKYFDMDGRQYLSVSKFIELFTVPFDRDMISRAVAKKRGISQAEVLVEWDLKRDGSIDHGVRIHDCLEKFEKTTIVDSTNEDLRPLCIDLGLHFKQYYRKVPEAILYDNGSFVAGTTDKIMQKTSHKNSRVDFADYKTNLEKGIYYENDYGKYLTGPLSHLMDCNYNRYSLQLSIYAYLYQKKTGRNIGTLSIIYIPPDDFMKWRSIPVPYMKKEAEAMFEDYMNRKQVRLTAPSNEVNKQYPLIPSDVFTIDEDDF